MIVSLVLLLACGEKESDVPSQDTAEDTGVTEPGSEPSTEPDTDVPQREVCGPQPNDHAAQIAVDLFEKVLEVEEATCYLERLDVDSDGDGVSDSSEVFTAPTELDCEDPNNCEQELPSFALAWSQHSEISDGFFDRYEDIYEGLVEGRRVIADGVETLEIDFSFELTGNTASRRVERVYSASGNMLQETYYFNSDLWFITTNEWENGLLVEQEMQDFINSNGGTTSMSWTYDEDLRMSTSAYSDSYGRSNTAAFSYDDEGRLEEISRSVSGEPWLIQTWTYEGDELVSRSNQMFGVNTWITSADNMVFFSPGDYTSHWDQSLSTENEDCTTPPLSFVHGYPDGEQVYQLGWSRNDVPDRVGFAYGYSGYGWMYGDLSWFGHGGIAGMYEFDGSDDGQSTITMTYENGVLIGETVEVSEEGEVTLRTVRNREVQNGRIISDELTTTRTTDEGVDVHVEQLNATYDNSGNLVERSLSVNEDYVHYSTWVYDENEHLVEHGVWGSGTLHDDPVDQDGSDTELPHLSTYRQTITDDAQEYERIREQRDRDATEWELVDIVRRGPHSLGEYQMQDNGFVVVNSDEQVVMTGSGDVENPEYYTVWTEDEHTLLSTWEEGTPESVLNRTYTHTCTE